MSIPWKKLATSWNCISDATGAIHRCKQDTPTIDETFALDATMRLLREAQRTLSPLLDAHPSQHKMVKP
jgi:hypothetical protein